jgi:hypothetical protein
MIDDVELVVEQIRLAEDLAGDRCCRRRSRGPDVDRPLWLKPSARRHPVGSSRSGHVEGLLDVCQSLTSNHGGCRRHAARPPDVNTNTIAVNTARSSVTAVPPPCGLGGNTGISGCTISRN